LEEMREVEIQVVHHWVEAVKPFVLGVLVAQDPVRESVLVVRSIEQRDAKAPIEMVALDLIGRTLEVQRSLVQLDRVGLIRIGSREVAAGSRQFVEAQAGCADIGARLDPAVDDEAAVLPSLAVRPTVNRVHQRAAVHVFVADRRGPAYVPGRIRPRGIRYRRRWEILTVAGGLRVERSVEIGRRRGGVARSRLVARKQMLLIALAEALPETRVLRVLDAAVHRAAVRQRGGAGGRQHADGEQVTCRLPSRSSGPMIHTMRSVSCSVKTTAANGTGGPFRK